MVTIILQNMLGDYHSCSYFVFNKKKKLRYSQNKHQFKKNQRCQLLITVDMSVFK